MRLGACTFVIAGCLALSATPAHAKPTSAVEAVSTSIAEVSGYVDTARQIQVRTERQALRESLQRDNAALRDLRTRLRAGEVTGRFAKGIARHTASCAADKLGYGSRFPERFRAGVAEITEGGQAALDAYDPERENADRIEELVAEAYEHRDLAASQIAPTVTAFARIRCYRPDATLEPALAKADATQATVLDGREAILEAAMLVDQQFPD